jgi:type III secretory pathway component EscS
VSLAIAQTSLSSLMAQALLLALWLALPLLVATVIAGVVTGVLGAITQVQDPAVGLGIRVAAVAVALVAFAPFLAHQLLAFAQEAMAMLGRLGHG